MAEGVASTNAEGAAQTAPSAPTGSGLDLIGLTKVFPGGTVAVDDVNLHVDHGEYVVLLGPSGSEERRVGKECRPLCRSRWSPYH